MQITERDIGAKAHPSAEPWEDIFESVQFPEDLRGLTILDVGAGASDATARLVELGADAYALDPLYKSTSDLKGKVRIQNKIPLYSKDAKKRRHEALERFMASFKNEPERYKTASATQIPFPDDTFDIVYSVAAVLRYLDLDLQILLKAVSECLRVAKPGGRISFAPYMQRHISWPGFINDLRIDNEKKMLGWFNSNPQVTHVREVGEELFKTLVIIKKSPVTNLS